MRWLLGIVVLVVASVLLAMSLQTVPPPADGRMAVATRLEAVVPLVEELGVGILLDDPGCRALMLELDETYADPVACALGGGAFTAEARAISDRLAAAVPGLVPGGRIRMIEVAEDHADVPDGGPLRRTITFRVAPQVLGRFDSPFDEWRWSWSEAMRPGERGNLSDHWSFSVGRRNEG